MKREAIFPVSTVVDAVAEGRACYRAYLEVKSGCGPKQIVEDSLVETHARQERPINTVKPPMSAHGSMVLDEFLCYLWQRSVSGGRYSGSAVP
jgi:hypothetical protein